MKRLVLIFLFFPLFAFAQFSDNFESGTLNGWTESTVNHWIASDVNPIDGLYSMQHNFDNPAADHEQISHLLNLQDINNGTCTWQFQIRHAYDPSSSNCWAVYLFANQDATQMFPAGTASGYVLGVNFTGSDDIIKLWKIEQQTITEILTTGVNWQTAIGTTTAAGFEITRTASGIWTVKIDSNGGFENLTLYGTANDSQLTDAQCFGVYYKYSSSQDRKLWVDDVSVSFLSLNQHDNTSLVTNPQNQIISQNISSLYTTEPQAVTVFSFKIADLATNDNLPTNVTQMTLKPAPNNTMDWATQIKGIALEGDLYVQPDTVLINNSKIIIKINSSDLEIINGGFMELNLGIYLKDSNITDNSIFQCLIDSTNHGFSADTSGSAFSNNFHTQIVSNPSVIQVLASKINITNYPQIVTINNNFSVSVNATDNNNNLDLDCSNPVDLQLVDGIGHLTSASGLNQNFTNGIFTWNDLQYDSLETFSIQAHSAGLENSLPISISASGNSNSLVSPPNSQVQSTDISSVADNLGSAVEVFRFKIADAGAGDLAPTRVKQIYLKNANPESGADWSNSLQGVRISDGINNLILGAIIINDNYLKIPILENQLNISDNSEKEITISIYLKTTKIVDNSTLQFYVDSTNHEFLTYPNSSAFSANFPQKIYSEISTIRVNDSKLRMSEYSTSIEINRPFNLRISACDKNNNIDLDANNLIYLSRAAGTGILSTNTGFSVSLSSGNYLWNDLIYNTIESFSMQIESAGIETSLSSAITATGNKNTSISNPEQQIEGSNLPSLYIAQNQAVNVLRFAVRDSGFGDAKATNIKQITIKNGFPQNSADWEKNIDGVTISVNNMNCEIDSFYIYADKILISLIDSALLIPDNSEKIIDFGIYFNQRTLEDNKNLQFMISSTNHEFTSFSNGSQFSETFPFDIYSNVFSIQVISTQLIFNKFPYFVAQDSAFKISINATDQYFNCDVDASNSISLSKYFGNGEISTNEGLQATLQNGRFTWNNLKYNTLGNFGLQITDFNTQEIFKSDTIVSANSIKNIFTENFEQSELLQWINTTHWTSSSYMPISDNRSLKHNLSNVESESYISHTISPIDLRSGMFEWKVQLKNGNFDPTSSNRFWVWLVADKPLNEDSISGYVLGVNYSGSSDLLTLWKIRKSAVEKAIITSNFNWNFNQTLSLQVIRTSEGVWQLNYTEGNQFENLQTAGKAFENEYINLNSFSLFFDYTSSNAGHLWFDNLDIQGINTAPSVKNIESLNDSTVKVGFSEPMNRQSCENFTNYLLQSSNNQIVAINQIQLLENNTEAIIGFSNLLSDSYKLSVFNCTDIEGLAIDSAWFSFSYVEPPKENDLVINELMVDPTPVVGLPDAEYIEIFNRSANAITLNNWTLTVGTSVKTIPTFMLKPDSFAILCSTTSAADLQPFGKVVVISSFPTLTNTGQTVSISDSHAKIITTITYTDKWYQDNVKFEGGWSLERINPNLNCQNKSNWLASNDVSGGTPGRQNSVFDLSGDMQAPNLERVDIIQNNGLRLFFSESITNFESITINDFTVNQGIGNPQWFQFEEPFQESAILTFANNFEMNKTYTLTIAKNLSDCAGNLLNINTSTFAVPIPAQANDLIINEIMVDPTPAVGLPDAEYIEVFNRSSHAITLINWTLTVGTNVKTIPSFVLKPDSFAIFCSTSAESEMLQFGKVVAISSFPTLTNSGQTITISDVQANIITSIRYTDIWYQDSEKNEGGWSLERINPNLNCDTRTNWLASNDISGGTPCRQNSVYDLNYDTQSPNLLRVAIDGKNALRITFDESITNFEALQLSDFTVNQSVENPQWFHFQEPYQETAILTFTKDFEENKIYSLTISKTLADCAGNLLNNNESTFAVPMPAKANDVIINEVLFYAKTGGSDFVEIYNRSQNFIDLSTLQLATRDRVTQEIESKYLLSKTSYLLLPNEYLVLSADTQNIKQNYQTINPNGFLEMSSMASFPMDSGSVVLLDTTNLIIDVFHYSDKMHFGLLSDKQGVSLERVSFVRPSNERSNWQSAAENVGFATPAYKNSQYRETPQTTENEEIVLEPEVFSPDNDGYNDVLNIRFKTASNGYLANITIFDSKGRNVRQLTQNELLSTEGILSWDGLTDSKQKARMGIYIIFVELFDLKGNISHFKKICVLSNHLK